MAFMKKVLERLRPLRASIGAGANVDREDGNFSDGMA
jgi:hypothetical protein